MKLTGEPKPRRLRATDVAGVEQKVQFFDFRQMVQERWPEIFSSLVKQLRELDVERVDQLPIVLDMFHHIQPQLIEELKSEIGPDQFSFERLKQLLDKVNYNEDEVFMLMNQGIGQDHPTPTNKAPKAVVLKLLFPGRANELLRLTKDQIDNVIETDTPTDFPGAYVQALRLDPDRASLIRQSAARIKAGILYSPLDFLRKFGKKVNTFPLERLAESILIFPEARPHILSEFRPVLEEVARSLALEQSWEVALRKGRALAILFYGAELNADGVFEINFPRVLQKPTSFPIRPEV